MTIGLVRKLQENADHNPIAPAFISLFGATSYAEVVEGVIKFANHLADRNIPRLSRALLNIANPDLRFIAMTAAMDYGLIPIIATPEVIKADYDYDLVIGGGEPFRRDIAPDINIDATVLAGKFSDGKLRDFPERADDDLLFVSETTGTTGRPKLVAVTYGSNKKMLAGVNWDRYVRGDRVMTTIGSATRYQINLIERTLLGGGAFVSAPSNPLDCLKFINLFDVTQILTVPYFLEELLTAMEKGNLKCPTIKKIRLTGATFTPHLVERFEKAFPDVEFRVGYGTSEVGGISNGLVTAETYRPGYVGKVTSVLKFVTFGSPGEPGLLRIVNDPDYFSRFIVGGKVRAYEGPIYEVPDIGYFDNGNLYLTGRADEVYNFSGNVKAYSLIREILERLSPLRETAVVSGASLGDERDLVIAIVADRPVNLDDLGNRLAEKMELRIARPHLKLYQTDKIPRNHMGKVDREGVLEGWRRNSLGR